MFSFLRRKDAQCLWCFYFYVRFMISGTVFSPFGLGWILIYAPWQYILKFQIFSAFLHYSALIFKACLPAVSFECALVFGRQRMKYENISQMHKYKTTSVHKYKTTSTQIQNYKYTNTGWYLVDKEWNMKTFLTFTVGLRSQGIPVHIDLRLWLLIFIFR